MYGGAERNKADVIVCEYITFRNKESLHYYYSKREAKTITNVSSLLSKGLMTSSCNKLIRRKVITDNQIKFSPTMTYGEDLFFCWKSIIEAKSSYVIEDILYGYRLTSESASTKYHPHLYESYCNAFEELRIISRNKDDSDKKIKDIDICFVKRISSFVRMSLREKSSLIQKYHKLKRILNDNTIQQVLKHEWDELIDGESKHNIKIYYWAKKNRILSLLFNAWLLEGKSYLAAKLKR